MPVVACPLDLHPRDSVDISYEPSAMEKERRYESLSRYFILFNSFFEFFWRLYVEEGYIWVVRLELTSVRLVEANKKRKNVANALGFLGILAFFHEKQSKRERCASAIEFFLVFSVLTFFSV